MPNVVIVVVDTLRDLERDPSTPESSAMPTLHALRQDACSFRGLVATAPWTVPSHAGLLSGLDPWRIAFEAEHRMHVVPETRGLADLWRERGGESVAFSANALVSPGSHTLPGYDDYNPGLGFRTRFAPMIHASLLGTGALMESVERGRPPWPIQFGPPGEPDAPAHPSHTLRWLGWAYHQWAARLTSGHVLAGALREYLRRRKEARPLHLMMNLMEAHEPHFAAGFPKRGAAEGTYFPSINLAYHAAHLAASAENPAAITEAYGHGARTADSVLARLLEVLRTGGILDDSWFLFVSDHGQSLGEHGYYGHGRFLYNELVQIPGILVRYRQGRPTPVPREVAAKIDHRHLFDLVQGLMEGAEPNAVPELVTRSTETRGPAVSYYEGNPTDCRDLLQTKGRYQSVRMWRDAEVATFTDEGLERQIRSVEELSTDAGLDSDLGARAKDILERGQADPTRGVALDVEVDERLKSWGYL